MEVQKTEKNASVDGKNVILDIFAIDADGKNYDVLKSGMHHFPMSSPLTKFVLSRS